MAIEKGTLYLCATPIGNLEDITYRAVRILREVALVAAEDTRHTRKLLSHFDIHTNLVSYHEHNKLQRGPELIGRMLAGDSIAVVSDAGMPGISDPGADIVKQAIEAGITVCPVPGPNAALAGLVCSGLDTTMFVFIGFLPKTAKKRRQLIGELAGLPYTLLFYESPHRLESTLAELAAGLGDREAAAGRELTKKFEEFKRGTLKSLQEHFSQTQPRGEFTLIVAGNHSDAMPDKPAEQDPVDAVLALMNEGMGKKEALRSIAERYGRSRRELYQALLERET